MRLLCLFWGTKCLHIYPGGSQPSQLGRRSLGVDVAHLGIEFSQQWMKRNPAALSFLGDKVPAYIPWRVAAEPIGTKIPRSGCDPFGDRIFPTVDELFLFRGTRCLHVYLDASQPSQPGRRSLGLDVTRVGSAPLPQGRSACISRLRRVCNEYAEDPH